MWSQSRFADFPHIDELAKQADEQFTKWNDIIKTDLAAYNRLRRKKRFRSSA